MSGDRLVTDQQINFALTKFAAESRETERLQCRDQWVSVGRHTVPGWLNETEPVPWMPLSPSHPLTTWSSIQCTHLVASNFYPEIYNLSEKRLTVLNVTENQKMANHLWQKHLQEQAKICKRPPWGKCATMRKRVLLKFAHLACGKIHEGISETEPIASPTLGASSAVWPRDQPWQLL